MRVLLGVGRKTSDCGLVPGADGDPWSGCLVARRRLTFISGEALRVLVPLYLDCVGIPCNEVSTCVPGRGCVSADVDPETCTGVGCDELDLRPDGSSTSAQGSASSGDGEGAGGAAVTGVTTTTGVGGEGGATSTGESTSVSSVSTGGSYCGDDTTDFGEECDDGNNDPGDGCSHDCETEGACSQVCPDPTASCLVGTCLKNKCTTLVAMDCNEFPGGTCDPCGRCCQGGGCTPTRCPQGGPCDDDLSCASRFCRQGVCCDTDCSAPGASCVVRETQLADGTCGPIAP